MKTVEVGRTYLPEGHAVPQTPTEAILAAKAVLEEEGRWAQSMWFHNGAASSDNEHHDEYEDNPFCNSWKLCMMGAVRVVTVGLAKTYHPEFERHGWGFSLYTTNHQMRRDEAAQLYRRTEAFLDDFAMAHHQSVDGVHFNDIVAEKREDVLNFLDNAAKAAKNLK